MKRSRLLREVDKFLVDLRKAISVAESEEDTHKGVPLIKAFNDELREEVSVVYSPFVLDGHGQWMSDKTIVEMEKSLRKGFFEDKTLSLNFAHMSPLEKSEVELLDLWLLDKEYKVGDKVAPEGTLVAKVKYHNEKLWEMRKAGVIGGFSLHGKRKKNKGE